MSIRPQNGRRLKTFCSYHSQRVNIANQKKTLPQVSQWRTYINSKILPKQWACGNFGGTWTSSWKQLFSFCRSWSQQDAKHFCDYFSRFDQDSHKHGGNTQIVIHKIQLDSGKDGLPDWKWVIFFYNILICNKINTPIFQLRLFVSK